MIDGIPKISALIICYKQEELIHRALDSLLSQKDFLYEICVSDDCSPDNTWQVLLDYQKQYPDLIKLHQNNPNVGIFENFEQVWTMPTGDIIYQVSGDDECGEGWLKRVVDYIQEEGIDYKNELFCIYGNFKCLYPNGDYYIVHNSAINKYPDQALRLALRGLICNRSACFSKSVLKKFDKVSQGRSHIVEMMQDTLLQLYAEKNYYLEGIGNIYYANVGVSAHLDEETLKVRNLIRPFTENFLRSKGIAIRKTDEFFGKYQRAMIMFRFHHGVTNIIKALWYYILSFDFRYSFLGDNTRRYVFALLRRLPHKEPLCFK